MLKIIAACILPLMFLLASCNFNGEKPVILKGSFPDGAGFNLVLQEMNTGDIRSVDSVTLDQKGSFSFIRIITEPGFWLLRSRSGKIMVLLLNPGDHVDLSGKIADFPGNVILNGPPDAALLNGFFRSTRQGEREVDSLESLLLDRQDSPGYFELTQKVDTLFRQIWQRQRANEMDFITRHPASLASLIVLNYAFGMKPVLSPETDFAWYQKVDSALQQSYPENKHVKYHHQRVADYKAHVPGGR